MRNSTQSILRSTLLFALMLGLAACGGDGGGDVRGSGGADSTPGTASNTQVADTTSSEVVYAGSVGDGPITGATVTVYSVSGTVLDRIVSDGHAKYQVRIKTRGQDYPLRLEASGGIDLVTGRAPDFTMVSVIVHPSVKTANINPFSTLIALAAEKLPGGISRTNVSTATTRVMDKLSLGLDSRQVPDPITSTITDSNVAHIVKASEALGEVIRRTRDLMATAGQRLDGDAVMAALAADITDGLLDGRGSDASNATISAVAKVVSGQVLVEALSNNLRVDGIVATGVLDQSILTTHPGVSASELTGNVRTTASMLQQARIAVAAARVLDTSTPLANIARVLAGLNANTTASSVATALPADSSLALSGVVGMTPFASPVEIAAVNAVVAAGSSPAAQNTPPSISGSPTVSVVAGNFYSFQPVASDADGNALTFNISGRPGWASV
ncbi:MAG: hypothetical protein OEY45_05950, partial [Gammaproteobacteria bacterium]|nr:hypothetical protein [Gammaproteobacteria bacterium]